MCTQNQLDIITKKMIECYHSIYGNDIVGIFLYGSYARGDYDNESDIDITAVVKGKRIELQKKLKHIWNVSVDVGMNHDVIVSPTVIPYEEFEKYKEILPYYRNIVKGGIKIG